LHTVDRQSRILNGLAQRLNISRDVLRVVQIKMG
jgi:hypothetical protein